MMIKPSKDKIPPHLQWPEEGYGDECEAFYAELLCRLGLTEWVAVVPNPAPLGGIRRAFEADCKDLLQPLEMLYDGVAWLCPRSSMSEVLPGLFHARQPELAFLTFDVRPDVDAITTALRSTNAGPASRILFFEDDELVEIREA